ncbi:sensor histidine kinase [Actinomycetes bacterium KLBMP 9797]
MRTGEVSTWDRRYGQLVVLTPWLLLIPSVVINQATPGQTAADRTVTLMLVLVAAVWVYGWHTRPRRQHWQRTAPAVVYFAGMLVLFVALMARDTIFVLFTITGFFHAYQLKPWPLGVAGVLGTSVALNTMTSGAPEATAGSLGGYLGLITVQTAAIGAGIVFAEKAGEQQRHRDEMVARLEAALEENAGLHAQLLTQAREAGVLDERQRMARELHDTLAQGLAGIITQVQAAQRVWSEPTRARPHVDRALALAKDNLTEARRSVQALRPRQLEEARLPEAVTELARRWADETGVRPRVEITGEPAPLSPAIEVALFRVAQEALTNVAKHAGAARVGVTLSYLGDIVLLDVRDDGVGIRSDAGGRGFGLNSMRQRIRGVGGAVTVESVPGEGTTISASVPMIAAEAR